MLFFTVLCMMCVPSKKEHSKFETENFAKTIVKKSIQHHGGMALWQKIRSIQLSKEIKLYSKSGALESVQNQSQFFQLQPALAGIIQWKKNDNQYIVVYKNNVLSKFVNNKQITDLKELERARNMFFAAQYVICQPFKLLDASALLSYEGVKKFKENMYHAVRVRYAGDTTQSDQWTYYFDKETTQLLVAKVVHKGTTSWIHNRSYVNSSGIKFNQERESFVLDTLLNKSNLRASYVYNNYSIIFLD